MKLALRAVAMLVVFAGLAAASVSSATARAIPSQMSVVAGHPTPNSLPIPICGPSTPCTGN
jgi:hypothetical protein